MTLRVKAQRHPRGEDVEVEISRLKTNLKKVVFSFAFDTPGLDQGVDVYTPEVGEFLYNGWFDMLEWFNGTTPIVDITVTPFEIGLLANAGIHKLYNGSGSDNLAANGVSVDARSGQGSFLAVSDTNGYFPAKFISEDPLKLYVTQDGKCDGTGLAINSTEGLAKLILLILTND